MDALSVLFDVATIKGLIALVSIHVHLSRNHHAATTRIDAVEAKLDAHLGWHEERGQ